MKKTIVKSLGILLIGLSLLLAGCLQPSEPRLGSAAIGVSDIERSTEFYTQIMGMSVKYRVTTPQMEKVVLEFKNSPGSDVVLMHYTDSFAVNYTYNPDKLVFYVQDAYAVAAAIYGAGYTIVAPPTAQPPELGGVVVGMAFDPDKYLVEIVEDQSLTGSYLGAVGIGVSDLETSADFYTRIMGMTEQYRLSIPYFMDEIILQYPYEGGGSALVLMHYFAPRNYTNVPVKLGFYVNNVQKTVKAIEDEGLEVIISPKRRPKFNPKAYGLAKDMDGYLIEVKQSVELKTDKLK